MCLSCLSLSLLGSLCLSAYCSGSDSIRSTLADRPGSCLRPVLCLCFYSVSVCLGLSLYSLVLALCSIALLPATLVSLLHPAIPTRCHVTVFVGIETALDENQRDR